MYFSRLMRDIHLKGIVGRAKGSIQEQIGADREVSARHKLVLRGTDLKKATRAVICKVPDHGKCRAEY